MFPDYRSVFLLCPVISFPRNPKSTRSAIRPVGYVQMETLARLLLQRFAVSMQSQPQIWAVECQRWMFFFVFFLLCTPESGTTAPSRLIVVIYVTRRRSYESVHTCDHWALMSPEPSIYSIEGVNGCLMMGGVERWVSALLSRWCPACPPSPLGSFIRSV